MYKNVLQGIDHVAVWPIISFVIFFLFFIILLWYAFTVDKTFIHYMKDLPSADGTESDKNAELKSKTE